MIFIDKIFNWLTKNFGDVIEKPIKKNDTPQFSLTKFENNPFDFEKTNYPIKQDVMSKLLKMSSTRGYIEETSGIEHRDWNRIAVDVASDMPWKVITDTNAYKDVPIALYFDFSLSNYKICHSLAEIALKLLKKDTMLYIGENGEVERSIIVKNHKLLSQDMSAQEAFFEITNGEINGLKIQPNDENSLAFLSKKFHNKKIWVFSDFDIADSLVQISRSIKITWFCTEKMNYGMLRKEIQDDIIENFSNKSELISLNSFEDLSRYADGNGNEMNREVREGGFI